MALKSYEGGIQQELIQPSLAISSWIVCSVGTSVFNKMAISVFPLPCTIVFLQMAFTVLAILVFGYRSLHFGSFKDMLRWSLVTPFFVGAVLTSMITIQGAPLSLLITFRALVPVMSYALENSFSITPSDVRLATICPLTFIIVGSLLYAKDIEHTTRLAGCGLVLINTTFSLVDRLLQRRLLGKDECPVDISTAGVTLLNNLFGIAPLLIAAFCMEEYRQVPAVWARLDMYGVLLLVANCSMAAGISFAGTVVQRLISATSFLVLINANKFMVLFIEVTFLHIDKALTLTQGLGAVTTLLGSLLWANGFPEWDRISFALKKRAAAKLNKESSYGSAQEASAALEAKPSPA